MIFVVCGHVSQIKSSSMSRLFRSRRPTTIPPPCPREIFDKHLGDILSLPAASFLDKVKTEIPIEEFYILPRELRDSVLARVLGDGIFGWSNWMFEEKAGLPLNMRSNHPFPRHYIVRDPENDVILNEILEYAQKEKKVDRPASRKRKQVSLTMRRKVWAKTFGESVGMAPCTCCRLTMISQLSFHAGHIQSHAGGGGTTLDNLLPVCQSCNSSMGSENMTEFKERQGFV